MQRLKCVRELIPLELLFPLELIPCTTKKEEIKQVVCVGYDGSSPVLSL